MADSKEKTVFYWLDRVCLESDGSISIPVTTTDGATLGTGAKRVLPTSDEYQFWRWLVAHPGYRRMIKGHELNEVRLRFEFESNMTRDH